MGDITYKIFNNGYNGHGDKDIKTWIGMRDSKGNKFSVVVCAPHSGPSGGATGWIRWAWCGTFYGNADSDTNVGEQVFRQIMDGADFAAGYRGYSKEQKARARAISNVASDCMNNNGICKLVGARYNNASGCQKGIEKAVEKALGYIANAGVKGLPDTVEEWPSPPASTMEDGGKIKSTTMEDGGKVKP